MYNILIGAKHERFIPRSGLILGEALIRNKLTSKHGLDIGTGESGILAHCLIAAGVQTVTAVDIKASALHYAKSMDLRAGSITWIESNIFAKLTVDVLYDIIVSNPPQMPMRTPGELHDYGGEDGREIILKIIEGCSSFLTTNGQLYILCFDFLGVDTPYNTRPSLIAIAESMGFNSIIISRNQRRVRNHGKTKENIAWIKEVYPGYVFRELDDGTLIHDVFVLQLKRVSLVP
ncbi:MAG: hypothetical protein A3J55_00160 [Candidatus Ryanbacteria bacterium RIFCSPHIGHO2_02_FULL_45_17b]|uniref:Methyltransferase small domain-containing protein n=1 Tax=Candidatus Ryanbacteria bacterium RIFCSPHIGHO2_01_FULL_45_22 TaxID=1802114 RepID=A0A1G2G155_9BACT|nr:MAG: hypothetical protein A2719_02625 [Candidatus Ryanbacteria bacterium RIFCSPHIGHO2_01_FULL_45_22]OGZ46961.1 MAG: hypothetical protein A3J55_00160 [Candidatus Ryanbacteria bacterium RIFCSPHIGHO2_02_FULL_45_17b]